MRSKSKRTWRFERILAVAATLALVGVFGASCGDDDDDTKATTISITGNYSVEVGKTLTLKAATTNGTDSDYTWASSDDKIATVDAKGVVTAVAAGETVITATGKDTGVKGTHPVVVIDKGTTTTPDPVVTIEGDFLVQPGKTITLTAKTTNGTDSGYDWKSSDDKIATVDDKGVVTGVAEGSVKITATGKDTKKEATLGVYVRNDIPNLDKWKVSAHANKTSAAFTHWDKDTPPEIPTSCARCHSTAGFMDYIGADGSAKFKVDKAAPVGSVIECKACHNSAADTLKQVTFPSGVTIADLGREARCMTCHQGRASKDTVDARIKDAAPADDDTVSSKLGFINIHYYPAGATLYAGRVRGGYQYDGKLYDVRFRHVPQANTCLGCHDAHSQKVKVDVCKTCHTGVSTAADLKKIRMLTSSVDYDGDGNVTESLHDELMGLKAKLLDAIKAYAKQETGVDDICYGTGYPYFFKDDNGNGTCDSNETTRYATWTARLLKAAYNYQMVAKDPGGFAHNAKYLIQLAYDSIMDLNSKLTAKIDMSKAARNDPGHFNGAGEPARHWDDDDALSGSCAKCHGGSEGLTFYLKYGTNIPVAETANALDCATCHVSFGTTFATRIPDSVTFPGGTTVEDKGNKSNLCMTCHSGRTGKADIDARIATGSFRFLNVHYLPSAATKLGKAAKVGYEYPNKTYSGAWNHTGGNNCIDCHKPKESNHTFQIADVFAKSCVGCHAGKTKASEIRTSMHAGDYDGDNNTTESLGDEISGLGAKLLAAIQAYGTAGSGGAICYSPTSYPYWFKDTNANGTCDTAEAVRSNSYAGWDATLMKAAHNYQIYKKEPGAWAHNFNYMGQLLYDSIENLGGATAVTGLTRPTP